MTAAPSADLRERFLGGMSHAACTVNVVTTDGNAGRGGVTVSAMSSISADTSKPTLLVCVHHLSPAASKILENGVFAVNVLRDDQSFISDTFAGRFGDRIGDKFDCADWTAMSTGSPRVVDPLVTFDCKVISSDLVGTHYVFFGEVEDLFIAERGSPLIYANRAYGSAWRIDRAVTMEAGRRASGEKLTIGCYHTFGPYVLPAVLAQLEPAGFEIELFEGDQRKVTECLATGQAEVALIYDLDLPEGLDIEVLSEIRPYVLLPEGHELAHRTELTPNDLADLPMVLLNSPPSAEYFLAIMRNAGVEPDVAYQSASFEMVRGLVGHGLGYSLLATKPASAMIYDGKSVISRPLKCDAPASPVVLAARSGAKLSPAAARFSRVCRDFFQV